MGRQPKLKCAPYTQHNNRAKADRDHQGTETFAIKWTKYSGSVWYLVWLYCSLNLSSNGCFIGATEDQGSRVAWCWVLSFTAEHHWGGRKKKYSECTPALHMDSIVIVELVQPGFLKFVKWAQWFKMQIWCSVHEKKTVKNKSPKRKELARGNTTGN